MANFAIRLDLLKMKGAAVVNLKGKTTTKKCLVIPIEENDLFVGQKGCYLNLTAVEMRERKFEDTHLINIHLDKVAYDAMTDEERRERPILGGLHEIKPKPIILDDNAMNDLPF